MRVWYDRYKLDNLDGEYISRGYAEEDIFSVTVRFEYSEEQKEENRRKVKTMTLEQWIACCSEAGKIKSAYIFPVMEAIAKSFVCYQYDKEHGPEFDSTDWELFFWCKDLSQTCDGRIQGRDYSYVRLTFNSRQDALRHKELLDRLLLLVTERFSELDNLSVEVQHKTRFFDERIRRDAAEIAKKLGGMKCRYKDMDGKLVYTENGLIFMKKRARTHGYTISPSEILRMSWEMDAA